MKMQKLIFQKADQLFNFDPELEQLLLNLKEITDQVFWLEIYSEYVRKTIVPHNTKILNSIVINPLTSETLYMIHHERNCTDQLFARLLEAIQKSSIIEFIDFCPLVKKFKNREELISALNVRFVDFIEEIV